MGRTIPSANTQEVSNDKYLKLYKIQSNFIDYNQDTLENSLNFAHSDEDKFLVLMSIYETLKIMKISTNILPEITFAKNLLSDQNLEVLIINQITKLMHMKQINLLIL